MKSINRLAAIFSMCGLQFFAIAQVPNAKILFALKPFSTNPTPQTEFISTDQIYAKIILEKPFKEYCGSNFYNLKDHYGIKDKNIARVMSFSVKTKNEDGEYETASYTNIDLLVTKQDMELKEINIDIIPSVELASTPYSEGSEFFRLFADSRFADGKKHEFKIDIGNNNDLLNGITGLEFDANFSIDYKTSTEESQQAAFDKGRKAWEAAKLNGLKQSTKTAVESVKSMPLPLCFSKGVNPGYKAAEYSTDKILVLIKQKYSITEVLKLTFDKPDGVEDFRSLVDASTNVPTCKMGNHVFYFAFKDKDGSYRFAGGVLQRDYEGYGKYGEVFIRDYSPIQSEDPKFPIDQVRDGQGVYGVFVFDGTKLK